MPSRDRSIEPLPARRVNVGVGLLAGGSAAMLLVWLRWSAIQKEVDARTALRLRPR